MKHRIFFFFLFLHVSFVTIHASLNRLLSSDYELSNSKINCLYQDRYGYIWIATENGLNRYDGNSFTQYKTHDDCNNQFVYTVTEDSHGRLWIGTINGLEYYDRDNDSFVPVSIYDGDQLCHLFISCVLERENGEFWVASTHGGIAIAPSVDVEKLEIDTVVSSPFYYSHINALYEDNNEQVWIGTDRNGLFYCKSGQAVPQPALIKSGKRMSGVSSICSDNSGNLFVSTLDDGVYIKYAASTRFEQLPFGKFKAELKHVRTLTWNPQTNSMLIGTDGEGAFYYKIGMHAPQRFNIHGVANAQNHLKVHDFLLDYNHNLWIALYQKGVLFVPYNNHQFKYLGPKIPQYNLIGSSCVLSLYCDQDETLWVGTENDGLYSVDNEGRSRQYRDKQSKTVQPRTIMGIAKDVSGNIWLGTYRNGLVKLNPKTGEFSPIKLDKDQTRISSVTLMKNRWLWVTTYGAGFYRYDIQTGESIKVISVGEAINIWTTCVGVYKDDKVWLGSSTQLYEIIHPESKTPTAVRKRAFDAKVINSINQVSDTLIWVGTRNGLMKYNPVSGVYRTYTTQDGLSSNVICGVQQEPMGNLWVSSHRGLTYFNPQQKSCMRYYVSDGLQGNEFARFSYATSPDGTFYWGGIHGVTYFNYNDVLHMSYETLPLQLTSLKVNNDERHGIVDLKSFEFSYNDHNIEWAFSTFDFAHQERIFYTYRIKPLGDEWLHTSMGENKITITNLAPGRYVLEVRADSDYAQSEVKRYEIIITPPWYATTWAKFLWLLFAVLIIGGVIRYAIIRVQMKKELLLIAHEEELKAAKLQTFTNISHDIKTPMSLIMAPLQKLLEKDTVHGELYNMMYRNGRRIIKLIEQLLDVQTLDKGQFDITYRPVNLEGFVKYCLSDFHYEAERKSIHLSMHIPEVELLVWTDPNALEKILVNLLSNAFKFTPNDGDISLDVVICDNDVQLRVCDTGVGVEEANLERIFDRFYQVDSDYAGGQMGNGIGLNLSKSLAHMLHGKLYAEQGQNGLGTVFVLTLPRGNSHMRDEVVINEQWVADETEQVEIPEVQQVMHTKQQQTHKQKPSVLIVDDDEEIRSYLCKELEGMYTVYEADNGLAGLKMAIKERPTLIVSDVMMPGMDGKRFCKRVKQNIMLDDTPVILLTAKVKAEDHIEGLKFGADAYIEKPFNIDILKATIQNLIQRRTAMEVASQREEHKKMTIDKPSVSTPDEQLLDRINSIINAELANTKFNVTMLAEKVGISRVHLNRKLTKLTNQTTTDYIRSIRMEQAKQLLASDQHSIAEVAYAVGYNNLSYFSTTFKQVHGVTPRDFLPNK